VANAMPLSHAARASRMYFSSMWATNEMYFWKSKYHFFVSSLQNAMLCSSCAY
jgi:hypothetical protein